jgi:hypothetical protein
LPVRPACHASISFDSAPTAGAQLIVDYLHREKLLARDCRHVSAGDRSLKIKTHPQASRITCALGDGGQPVSKLNFDVDCGDRIEPTRRHFIVIGAMKAGTTTLFELLAKHPALCQSWTTVPNVSFPKEINYFRKLYEEGDTPLDYDWRFPFDAKKHAWTLDVSPGYAKWPGSKGVPARIRSLGGEIKLAYIMRDPVDRIESHIAHRLHHGRKAHNVKHCIRTSRYAMQLDKFMVHFARSDVLLLDFEQLKRDPAAIQTQIFNFLGIEHIASQCEIHNTRGTDFRLNARQRARFVKAVRSDTRRLINLYDFKPAERWLQNSTRL